MTRARRLLLVLLVVLSCVAIDQTTKAAAKMALSDGQWHSFAADTVRLQYAENPGAFLSLGASMSESWRTVLFPGILGISIAALLTYLVLASLSSADAVVSLSLIAGGGLSNLIDRLVYHGHVIDFLNVGIGPVRTGIFNLADVAITVGAVLFFISGTGKAR